MSEICSKLTMKIPERRQWRRSGIFIVNFEHISQVVSVVNFEHVIAGWVKGVTVTPQATQGKWCSNSPKK